MPKECTVKDIAQLAGISTGTVSRILNGAENVTPEIYSRTMQILKETGYLNKTRYRSGKNFKAGSRICVIAPDMSEAWQSKPLWAEHLAGIEAACRKYNYSFEIQFAHPELAGYEIGKSLSAYDGILLKMPSTVPNFLAFVPKKIPVVCFDGVNPDINHPQIAIDERAAGVMVTEALLKAGHRNIAFVNPESHHREFAGRCSGYIETMLRAMKFREELIVQLPTRVETVIEPMETLPDMTGVLDQLLSMTIRPTAVIFANDWNAAGFYNACAARKISIPETFSITGFDNVSSICEILLPSLSSVQLPVRAMAEHAAKTLFHMIENRNNIYRSDMVYAQLLTAKLVIRNSIRNLK